MRLCLQKPLPVGVSHGELWLLQAIGLPKGVGLAYSGCLLPAVYHRGSGDVGTHKAQEAAGQQTTHQLPVGGSQLERLLH